MAKGGGEACQACRQRGVRENLGGVPGSGMLLPVLLLPA